MALLKNFYGTINCLNNNKVACVSGERENEKTNKRRKWEKDTEYGYSVRSHTDTQKNDKFTHETNNNQSFKIANCVLISFIHEPFSLA